MSLTRVTLRGTVTAAAADMLALLGPANLHTYRVLSLRIPQVTTLMAYRNFSRGEIDSLEVPSKTVTCELLLVVAPGGLDATETIATIDLAYDVASQGSFLKKGISNHSLL